MLAASRNATAEDNLPSAIDTKEVPNSFAGEPTYSRPAFC